MLDNVKWGEYCYNDLFELVTIKKKLTKNDLCNDGKYPVYSSVVSNNGVMGRTKCEPDFITDPETPMYIVFGDHTRRFSVADESFSVMDNVKVLKPIKKLSYRELLFINAVWQKAIPNKGYSRHWSIAKKVKILLPTKNNKIDYDFMNKYISELEARHISELEAYLNVTGLKDYKLTDEEEKAIHNYKDIDWKEYRIGDLFEKIKTKKLPYKAKDLPTEPQGTYNLPCLTSSFRNQGLNYYAPRNGATILKNVISIPSNSDVYRAYFQSKEFTVLSDAYAIKWKDDEQAITDNQYLFMVAPINKVTDLPIYSYKKKLGGWNVVKEKKILLPHKNGNIDFDFLDTFIWAIKKTLIKKVVKFIEKR